MPDLAVDAFRALRSHLYAGPDEPAPFRIRDKRNTQDDPFDEYLAEEVFDSIKGVETVKASPLTTPDIVLYRSGALEGSSKVDLEDASNTLLAIEVKKLERNKSGSVARPGGLDYNTTPPCGTVRVFDSQDQPLDIRAFYLFVCLEEATGDESKNVVTAASLVDGNAINRDFELYLSITGQREKKIGLGNYGEGMDRQRPMLVFPNPLGWGRINNQVTLIHPRQNLSEDAAELEKLFDVIRSADGSAHVFGCYQFSEDVPKGWTARQIENPFPVPADRKRTTQRRGRFTLPFTLEGNS
jgi:hypothetical protein